MVLFILSFNSLQLFPEIYGSQIYITTQVQFTFFCDFFFLIYNVSHPHLKPGRGVAPLPLSQIISGILSFILACPMLGGLFSGD